MAASDPAAARLGGGIQQLGLIVAPQALQMRRHLLRAQFAHQFAVFIQQARVGTEQQ